MYQSPAKAHSPSRFFAPCAYPSYHKGLRCALLIIPLIFFTCQPQSKALKEGIALYLQNKLQEAVPHFEEVIQDSPQNAAAYEYLTESYRRLGKPERAIEIARIGIKNFPANSFLHTSMADAYNPIYGRWKSANPDSTWLHLQKAITSDPTNGNAWFSVWVESILRNDIELHQRANDALIHHHFFTPAMLAYSRWVLRALPANALLITNGDMDTYPLAAIQNVENLRPDIVIVNRNLLNIVSYARFIRDVKNIPLPFSDAQLDLLKPERLPDGSMVLPTDKIINGWLSAQRRGQNDHPLVFAVTVSGQWLQPHRENLVYCGPFFRWESRPTDSTDYATIQASLEKMPANACAGSMVSEHDRSPVRRLYTKSIVSNITHSALEYANYCINTGKLKKAEELLDWATLFEKNTEYGEHSNDEIKKLRKKLLSH